MSQVPFQLHYSLTRRQRLVPHLRIWGIVFTPFVIVLFAFFCVQTVVSLCSLSWAGIAVFGGLALGILVLFRGMFVGLLDVLLVRIRHMDIIVEENAAGVLLGTERWYFFLDGLLSIEQLTPGLWTLQHFNGVVVHIPQDAITELQLAHLHLAMVRGKTPQGIRAVIERGRALEQIERQQQGEP